MTTAHGWFVWDASWSFGIALLAICIALHAGGVVLIAHGLRSLQIGVTWEKRGVFHMGAGAIGVIVGVALLLAVMHGFECAIWAGAYLKLEAIGSPADAMLYSVDAMTTRGSHLALEHRWLMMSAIESVNGWLLFGISTAFLFAVIERIWPKL